jgi:phosphoenolpyruvate---glycerone phosphotransferase subunit DhaL
MESFTLREGSIIVDRIIAVIQENKQYLSDIDGKIGDGDHGINMNKGVSLCREALDKEPADLATGLQTLAKILLMKIGGSMGPLYGKFFMAFGKSLGEAEVVSRDGFLVALKASLDAVRSISQAEVGDKTLMDVLIPATEVFEECAEKGCSFVESLDRMTEAAQKGRDSTVDMVARIGRASRLGERSRGVMDAGAASCFLILSAMAVAVKELI